jgi:hypothetical protein
LVNYKTLWAISLVEQLLGFHTIRNQFAHDYPDDSEQNAATLNLAYSQATALLNALKQVREFTEKRV